jgi:hypothetical protein
VEGLVSPEEISQASAPDTSPGDAVLNRMWEHQGHLDTMLFQRANLFLVAESLLVVAYALILGVAIQVSSANSGLPLWVARIIAVFGLILTAAWCYVAHRHLKYYRLVVNRNLKYFPEYTELREQWQMKGPSSLPTVTYFLPLLAGAIWILFLAVSWR